MEQIFKTGISLYCLEAPYYLSGSPVIVHNGTLQINRFTSEETVILELENISNQQINSCTIQLTLYDAKNTPYEKPVNYCYEEISIGQGDKFGEKRKILLPDNLVRSFSVRAVNVLFSDNTVWENQQLFLPVASRKTLTESFQNEALVDKFKIRYGTDCKYKPETTSGLWYCTCGAVNLISNSSCYNCGRKLEALLSITENSLRSDFGVKIHSGKQIVVNSDELQTPDNTIDEEISRLDSEIETEERISVEIEPDEAQEEIISTAQQEEKNAEQILNLEMENSNDNEEPDAVTDTCLNYDNGEPDAVTDTCLFNTTEEEDCNEQEIKSEIEEDIETEKKFTGKFSSVLKRKLVLFSCIGIVVIMSYIVVSIVSRHRETELENKYKEAEQLLADGAYAQAKEAYIALGDYSDAEQKVEEIPYEEAMFVLHCAETGDSSALRLFENENGALSGEELKYFLYGKAKELFSAISNYRDSAVKLNEIDAYFSDYEDRQKQTVYDSALTLMEQKNYLQARDIFLSISGYKDSSDMVNECLYRRLCAVLDKCKNSNIRGIEIIISDSSSTPTILYIPNSAPAFSQGEIIDSLSACFQEEGIEIEPEESGVENRSDLIGYLPVPTALANKFNELNGYKDSESKVQEAIAAGDYTKEFYTLLKSGKLQEAKECLEYCKNDISDVDTLLDWIELYMPWEGTWSLLQGDTSLIPCSAGLTEGQLLGTFDAEVRIEGEQAILHIEHPDEEYSVDLVCTAGSDNFCKIEDGYYYYAKLIDPTVLLYMRYLENGTMTSSCVYFK